MIDKGLEKQLNQYFHDHYITEMDGENLLRAIIVIEVLAEKTDEPPLTQNQFQGAIREYKKRKKMKNPSTHQKILEPILKTLSSEKFIHYKKIKIENRKIDEYRIKRKGMKMYNPTLTDHELNDKGLYEEGTDENIIRKTESKITTLPPPPIDIINKTADHIPNIDTHEKLEKDKEDLKKRIEELDEIKLNDKSLNIEYIRNSTKYFIKELQELFELKYGPKKSIKKFKINAYLLKKALKKNFILFNLNDEEMEDLLLKYHIQLSKQFRIIGIYHEVIKAKKPSEKLESRKKE
jgi:hypothetical protein